MEYPTPSLSGLTIYTVSTVLYLSLLWGFVACLTISCLSYCISLAIKPFLYSTNMWTVPFHSSITLSDCIPFKDTTKTQLTNLFENYQHYMSYDIAKILKSDIENHYSGFVMIVI